MNDQELNQLLESLKNAQKKADEASSLVRDIETELPDIYWQALKQREGANKVLKTNETNVRNGAQQYYETNGILPVTPYLQSGINVKRVLKNHDEVISNIISRILAGDQSLISALLVDETVIAKYPDLGATWSEQITVTTRIQWSLLAEHP